jgi:3-hydroxyisobutyrate dehydrogenase
MKKSHIGFIGIGVMGAAMAENLAAAGYDLTLHDINRTLADKLASAHDNMTVEDTPRAVAEVSEIVITMLPSGKHVRDVTLAKSGLIEGFQSGDLLLDTSSSEPWLTVETSKSLKAKGVDMVDAPVSGALSGAQSGRLVFMVGGEKEPLSRALPLLQIMGKQIFHLGPLGTGHAMKSINNLITAMTFMATAEGLTIGKRFGLDPDVMTDVLNVSTGMSWISQTHIKQRITSRKFDDPFKLALMVKDIGIALELASSQGLSLPLSSFGQSLWEEAKQHEDKDSSISNMVRWIEDMTKTEITSGNL